MKARQKTAFFNPCFFPGRIESNRVCHLDKELGKWKIQTTLTVNAFGDSSPYWQASARVISPTTGRPVCFIKLTAEERLRVVTYLKKMLEGVGEGNIQHDHTLTEFNFTRWLSLDERRNLPERKRFARV